MEQPSSPRSEQPKPALPTQPKPPGLSLHPFYKPAVSPPQQPSSSAISKPKPPGQRPRTNLTVVPTTAVPLTQSQPSTFLFKQFP